MAVLTLIFLVVALVCFVAATFGALSRWNLVAAGLAFWVLIYVINAARALQ
jgi:hypothetical protein